MRSFLLILLSLTASPPSWANRARPGDIEAFFRADVECEGRLDELLYLGQAYERGIAVEEDTHDGGATSTLGRVFVRADADIVKAVRLFASLVGMKKTDDADVKMALASAQERGHGIVVRETRQGIVVRFVHVRAQAIAVIMTNATVESNPLRLNEFITEFYNVKK